MKPYALAALLLIGIAPGVQAQTAVEQSTIPSVGCYTLKDMTEVMHAGKMDAEHTEEQVMMNLARTVKAKESSGACFQIETGSGAFLDIRWEKPPLLWNGVVELRGMGSRVFYAPAYVWQRVE